MARAYPLLLTTMAMVLLELRLAFSRLVKQLTSPGRFVVTNRSDSAVTVVVTSASNQVDIIDPVSVVNSKAGRLTRNPSEADVTISTDLTTAYLAFRRRCLV